MKLFALVLAFLPLFTLAGCQGMETSNTNPVEVYVRSIGDVWAYSDGEHFALVGEGVVGVDVNLFDLPLGIVWPEMDPDINWVDRTAWFKSPDSERTQGINEPWPWWMVTRLRVEDYADIQATWGPISFENPPAPAPEATPSEPDPMAEWPVAVPVEEFAATEPPKADA